MHAALTAAALSYLKPYAYYSSGVSGNHALAAMKAYDSITPLQIAYVDAVRIDLEVDPGADKHAAA